MTKFRRDMQCLVIATAFTMLTSCSSVPSNKVALYQQLGGDSGIENIVDEFVYIMATHPKLASLFEFTDIETLRGHLEDQFCELSGGPCTYSGRGMIESHEGMNVSHGEFNLVVELLQQAMRTHRVPVGPQNRLIALLAPMHEDVVHR
ncbi:MAG: group 1 truncated hemoglobin [Gammaproteobacteria bacterium]